MKKVDFIVTKQNDVDVVRYDLGAADVYDDKAADKAGQLSNVVPFQYSDADGKRSITSYVREKMTLEALYKRTLNKKQVLSVLRGLVSAFEIGTQGIPISYIVKDPSYIYVNEESFAVKCILVPVKQDVMPLAEIPVFFRNVVSRIIYDEIDTDNYVAKLLTVINSNDFTISRLKSLVDEQLEAMGLFVSRENGLTGMPDSKPQGVQTPNQVKVNKIGVMNNIQNANRQVMMGQPQMQPQPMGQAMPQPQMQPQPMGQPMPKPPVQPMPQMQPQPMGQPMPKPPVQPMPQMQPMGQPMPKPPVQPMPQMGQPQMQPQPMGQPMPKPPVQPMPQMGQPQMQPQPMGQPMPKPPVQPMPQMQPQPMGQPMPKPPVQPMPQMGQPQMQPQPMGQPMPKPPVQPQSQPAPDHSNQYTQELAQPQQPEEITHGSLVGQMGSKPIPHIVRKKTGEVINITKPEFSIGKSKTKADYTIEDNSAISRVHCIIVQKDGVNYIKDNNSTNHTYLNGVELAPGKEQLLKNKTLIQMGDEEFTFYLRKSE